MVNLAIILEALKFYKLKNAKTIQIWFVLLYGLNILVFILPIGDTDFSAYYRALDTMLATLKFDQSAILALTPGNWFVLGMSLVMQLVGAFFGLMYATLYVGELESMRPRQAFIRSLAILPKILLLAVLVLIPAILSAFLFFIPLIVFAVMIYFLPLLLSLDKQPLFKAIQQSTADTRGKRLFIFAQVFLLSMFISLPSGLILDVIPGGQISYAIVSVFFAVLATFMQGRIMGILYLILVKKVQYVIPSKPNS
jgi:hypothetical protein